MLNYLKTYLKRTLLGIYNKSSNTGYILEIDVEYLKQLQGLHIDFPFSPVKMETEKCQKLMCNLYDKEKICYTYENLELSTESWINSIKRT